MNNLPAGAELLAIARELLNADIRPHVRDDARYTLAMIANAMAIAAREIEAGETPARAALARLDRLHGEGPRELHGEALKQAIAAHERRLAADIRAGRYDTSDARSRAMLEHLRESVEAKLGISNPKALEC
jgi:hypothetical protein